MGRWDRYWLIAALVAPFAVVLVLVSFLPASFTPQSLFGVTLPFSISYSSLLQTVFALMLLIQVLVRIPGARRRTHGRARALAGDLSAVPVSRIEVDPAHAPDIIRQPLYVALPANANRIRPRSLALAFGVSFAIIVFTALGSFVFLSATPRSPTRAFIDIGILFGGAIVSVVAMFLILRRYPAPRRQAVPPPATRPLRGVVASNDGLWRFGPQGPETLVRWQEARLLEVAQGLGQSPPISFTFYGPRSSITWYSSPSFSKQALPNGDSPTDVARPERALLDLIAARTGLTPRTFNANLFPDASTRRRWTRLMLLGALLCGVAVAALAATAAGALLLPLTHDFALDLYVAVSVALTGAGLLQWAVRSFVQSVRERRRSPAPITLPTAPPLAGGETITLTYRSTWRRWLPLLFFGATLLPNLVIALASFTAGPPGTVTAYSPVYLEGFATFAAGWVGVILLIASFMHRSVVIRASDQGLSWGSLGVDDAVPWSNVRTIPWSDVRAIAVKATANGPRFEVSGILPADVVSWPLPGRRLRPPAGQLAITAEELAALVVQRSGVPLSYAVPDERLRAPGASPGEA